MFNFVHTFSEVKLRLSSGRQCSSFDVHLERPFSFYKSCILGDLREKIFKIAWWLKCFFVKPSKARTVTLEQLVAMFSPLNLL